MAPGKVEPERVGAGIAVLTAWGSVVAIALANFGLVPDRSLAVGAGGVGLGLVLTVGAVAVYAAYDIPAAVVGIGVVAAAFGVAGVGILTGTGPESLELVVTVGVVVWIFAAFVGVLVAVFVVG